MTTLDIFNRPMSSNWADDDEDEFDFESWKAEADLSAPTVDSLPPLQLPTAQEESSFTVYRCEAPIEILPWSNSEANFPAYQRPSTTYQSSAHAELARRAMEDRRARPTHVELSKYEDGTISPHKRINYSSNWKKTKVQLEWDCRHTALLVKSKMREVEACEVVVEEVETEDIVDTETSVLSKIDFTKLCEDLTHAALLDHNLDTLDTIPDLKFDTSSDGESYASSTSSEVSKPIIMIDEGYYSDNSPPTSPTLDSFKEAVKIPYSTTRVGISPASAFIARPLHTHLLNVKTIDEEDISVSMVKAATSSWLDTLSNPWMGAAAMAVGVLTGMWFTRRN